MNRRSFLAALAALPMATKIEPQKTGLTTLTYGKYTLPLPDTWRLTSLWISHEGTRKKIASVYESPSGYKCSRITFKEQE